MKQPLDRRRFLASLAAASLAPAARGARWSKGKDWQWEHYGGDAGAGRYAPLDQIDKSNVGKLKVAWVHNCGDASERPQTTIESTPIVVDGVLYLLTPKLKIRALDAATGAVKWEFDPNEGASSRRSAGVSRGLCYWQSADGEQKRIFSAQRDALYSIDANTGKLDASFGQGGQIDLSQNFDHDMKGLTFRLTSPPVAYKDLVLVGGGGSEGPAPAAPGHIRGYDARTGERRWIFHTTPRPGEYGYDTWPTDAWKRVGGTNNWAGMSLDQERGWLFASTGSPAFDYWGGDRKGANLFGNCVLALDAETGERQWHFQVVHHDVWDYDLPAQPALVTLRQGGRTIDAVAQVTKQSFVFFFDRQTGRPIFPVEERKIPPSKVPGEELWPTQPFPTKPPPLSRIRLDADEITNLTPEAHAKFLALLEKTDHGLIYEPPSTRGTFVHPGFRGGTLWGGCSHDPDRNLLFANSDENTNRITLAPADSGSGYEWQLTERWKVRDDRGYPIVKPPWGYVTAIDMETGAFKWRVVNGEYPELTAEGIPKTGTPSHGGSIATKGGLLFFAGTFDRKFRAFDADTGEVLWEHQLNAGGFATPCSYEVNGKQYIVIAAGGGKGDSPAGDEYVCFSL
ncbi:MAG: pyrroloquinoline quinone-dependent dehydrogenase [Bryobacterales bacterium]